MIAYSPSGTSGAYDLWTGVPIGQPSTPSAVRTGVADAAYFGIEVENNLLACIRSSVGSPFYWQVFACASGLATGDPVILTGANAVDKAAASGSGTSKVIGFVREITSADTGCYISHFWYRTGLTVAVNDTIYLTDAGGVASGAGTFKHTLGIAISTTGALLQAGPRDGTLSSPDIGGDPATVGSGEDSGSATFAARADHKHALQFSGYPSGVGGTADSGTLAVAARLDHIHALTFSGNPGAVGTGSGGVSGSSTVAARLDHTHAMRTGYDDIIVPIMLVKSGGSSDPTLEALSSGTTSVKLYKFATGNEVHFSCELPHSYKEGTDIECHLHWVGSGSTGGTVVWQLDVQAVSMTGVWYISGTGELTMTGSGTLNTGNKMQYTSFGSITGTNLGIGTHIAGKLSRQGGTTTSSTYAATLGFHFQMDSFGSLNMASKT